MSPQRSTDHQLIIDKTHTNHSINMRLFALIFSSFLCSLISAEHVTVTYHFWEKSLDLKIIFFSEKFKISDEKIVEKVEWFTKFVANSNRFWTSNLVFQQHNEKIDRVQISR